MNAIVYFCDCDWWYLKWASRVCLYQTTNRRHWVTCCLFWISNIQLIFAIISNELTDGLVAGGWGSVGHLDGKKGREEDSHCLSNSVGVILMNADGHVVVVQLVLCWEEAPEEVSDLVDGAWGGTERFAEGDKIVVEVAVVEHVDTENSGIDVPLALLNQETVLCTGALTLGSETGVVVSIGLGIGENLVH